MAKYTKKNPKFFDNIRINNNIKEKRCTKCREWKPEDNKHYYYKNKSFPEKGFQSACIVCSRLKAIEYQTEHREEQSIRFKKMV